MKSRHSLNRIFPWLAVSVVLATVGWSDDRTASDPVGVGRLGTSYGVRRYAPDTWGLVGVDLTNRSDQPVQVDAMAGFAADPDVQYVRRLWLPPRSMRKSWIPVRTPPQLSLQRSAECVSMAMYRQDGRDKLLRFQGETVQHQTLLPLADQGIVTGLVAREDPEGEGRPSVDWAYEGVIAMRNQRGLSRRLAMLHSQQLVTIPEALDALEHLVIADHECFQDEAALSAIRGWLIAGGELWIPLEQTGLEGPERLLGEAFTCTLVNHVELNEIHIQSTLGMPRDEDTLVLEQPATLVRVIPRGMTVTHSIGEWPVAFWTQVGRGRVVFTTLTADGWLRPREARDVSGLPEDQRAWFVPIKPMDSLPVFQAPRTKPPQRQGLEEYATARIGYRIVPRSVIVAVLGLYCLSLAVGGVLLVRSPKPQRIGWLAPVLALGAAAVLAWFGVQAKHRVPAAVVHAQLVETSTISGQANVSGRMAVFSPVPSETAWGAAAGGTYSPDVSGMEGRVRRMVWTDRDKWQWEDLRLPPGVRLASLQQSVAFEQPVEVVGTFDEAGFRGQLLGMTLPVSDAVIRVPQQRHMAVSVAGDAVRCGPQDVLEDGEFIVAGLLDDEQRRRTAVYRSLLQNRTEEAGFPDRATLLAWTDPIDLGFVLPEDFERRGGALWSIPIRLLRPEPRARVVLPAPFLRYRVVRGPGVSGVSAAYDARSGEWLDTKTSTNAWLRFQIPGEVLPLKLERADIRMEITAADRTVEIMGLADGRPEVLWSKVNPIGVLEVPIEEAKCLTLDDGGGLVVGVHVSKPAEGLDDVRWHMESLELSVAGQGE